MTEPRAGLHAWVAETLSRLSAEKTWEIPSQIHLIPLCGDAGCRCYYRVNCSPSLLAVDAPPATEDSAMFIKVADYLRDNGVHTPSIVAYDVERGFLLVEDLGDELMHGALTSESVELLYGEALMTLLRMQQCEPQDKWLPPYDRDFLRTELNIFTDYFVEQLLQQSITSEQGVMLNRLFAELEDNALAQPQVLVHRDYHSRNMLCREGGAPGIVDFQGAMWGPVTYDLVSLLRDCYIRWPDTDVRRWAAAYGDMAVEVGIMPPVKAETFLRWFDLMGLQRHIKVLGIFARLHLRDGKTGYLNNLPLVMRYVLEVTEHYPAFAEFRQWFVEELLPVAEQQEWYSDVSRAGE